MPICAPTYRLESKAKVRTCSWWAHISSSASRPTQASSLYESSSTRQRTDRTTSRSAAGIRGRELKTLLVAASRASVRLQATP